MTSILRLNEEKLETAKAMFALMREVFKEELDTVRPSDNYLKNLLKQDHFYALAALESGKIVGALTGYRLDKYHSKSAELMVYDLAIHPEYQRKGIGRKLMQNIFNIARQDGIREVFVSADDIDDHAIAFYQSLQPSEYITEHQFNFFISIK